MKKIYLWLKKHIKCWNEGHDYYYSPYAEWFFCKRCGHSSKYGKWAKDQQYIDRLLIEQLIDKAWSLAYSMYQVGKDNLTPLTKDEFCKAMEE